MKLTLKKTLVIFGILLLSRIVYVSIFGPPWKVVGRYNLATIDVDEEMSLTYGDQIVVPPTVFAVGHNDKYIIVKQHPYNDIFYNQLHKLPDTGKEEENRNITNFYIVKINDQYTNRPDSGVFGPLTFDEYTIKKKELHISDGITFTKVIDYLK
jgi:hypothetical protein